MSAQTFSRLRETLMKKLMYVVTTRTGDTQTKYLDGETALAKAEELILESSEVYPFNVATVRVSYEHEEEKERDTRPKGIYAWGHKHVPKSTYS